MQALVFLWVVVVEALALQWLLARPRPRRQRRTRSQALQVQQFLLVALKL
jgi:hypothetical protein